MLQYRQPTTVLFRDIFFFLTIVNIKEGDWILCRGIKLHNVSLTMG